MSTYSWDKDLINSLDIDQNIKDILIAELEDIPLPSDPTISEVHYDGYQYKRQYIKNKMELYNMYPIISDLTFQLYKFYKIDNLIPYNLIVEDDFINPNNHIINFKNKNDNQISDEVHGRALKIPNKPLGFISMYLGKDIEDIPVFAHECGHLITHILYHDKLNPNFKVFSETESYYFELLMMDYIKDTIQDPDNNITDLLMSNRLLKTIYYIWDIKIQDIAYHILGNNITSKKINKKIMKCNTDVFYTPDDIKASLAYPLHVILPLVNSYLIALELYNLTMKVK